MMVFAESASALQLGVGLLVIGGILSVLLVGTKLKMAWFPAEKKQEQISPLPLPITVTNQFATKDELHELKEEVRELEKALPETERRILAAVEREGDKMRGMVNKMAEVATEGRRKLYEKDRQRGEKLASLATKANRTEADLNELKRQLTP